MLTSHNHSSGTIHPRHIIQATGHSGEAAFPSDIAGIGDFKGDTLVHSSQFQGPKANAKGKKAVIIGSCNSAHDIAQDFYEHGYDVTMVQRSSTLVVSSSNILKALSGIYSEEGVRCPSTRSWVPPMSPEPKWLTRIESSSPQSKTPTSSISLCQTLSSNASKKTLPSRTPNATPPSSAACKRQALRSTADQTTLAYGSNIFNAEVATISTWALRNSSPMARLK